MRLVHRIAAAGLAAPVARTFAEKLAEVASAKGGIDGNEAALIQKLLGKYWTPDDSAAPFEAIWPVAELFLTSCIYVAVADGHYDVEEARVVSAFAHRLGFSAQQLASLESRTFQELRDRGAQKEAEKG